ncbi:MAG: amidohydrolase [Clostridia bacterium]|nr:amidohydrolase [Clostridia bacterium]
MNVLQEAQAIQSELVSHRRYLHKNAETGLVLPKTQAYITETLQKLGYTPKPHRGGVVASLNPTKTGKAFLLRADADALPIKEKTGLPFACKTGNMHACGHDMHTAMLLGAAKLLKQREKDLKGEVRFLFQFGEETLEGATLAIKAGVLSNVTGAFTLHVATATPLKTGTVVLAGVGEIAPCADFFEITVKGKSCHGSTPREGVDALLAGAHIALALQAIPAREISVSDPAVLTLGKFLSGVAANAIADKANLCGSLRAYDEKTRAYIKNRIKEIVKHTANAYKAKAETTFTSGCPTLVNDEKLRALALAVTKDLLGEKQVVSAEGQRGGGSEDFAYVSQETPSVMLALSAGSNAGGYAYPLHHPKTDFDENALPIGAALFAEVALRAQKR